MRHRESRFCRLHVLLCCAVVTLHFGAPSARAEAPRSLFFLQGNELHRLSLADLHVTEVLSFPRAVDPADVRVAGDAVIWADRSKPRHAFLSWNGTTRGRIEPEPQHSADLENMAVEYDETGEISRLEPAMKDVYYDDFLLSADGTRVIWNVNVVSGVSPEEAVTAQQRHLLHWAEVASGSPQRSLAQDYSVAGYYADHGESRHLIQASKADPEWVFFARFEEQQLASGFHGLWRLNLRSGAVQAVDASLDRVLAVSEDERWIAHTPNDESCCGGINQTNNRVLARDLRTGREAVVFDEWGEFKNAVLEPGDEGAGEDYVPVHASFSPDSRRLAVTLRWWSSAPDTPPRILTTVRAVEGRGQEDHEGGKCVLGWDGRQAILGECRVSDDGTVRLFGSVFLYDPETKTETALPLKGSPLAPGYAPFPAANRW